MEVKFFKNYNSSNNKYQKLILCMPSTLLSVTTHADYIISFFLQSSEVGTLSHFISYKTKIENEYLAQDHNTSNRDLTSLPFHLLVFQNHHTTIPTLKNPNYHVYSCVLGTAGTVLVCWFTAFSGEY